MEKIKDIINQWGEWWFDHPTVTAFTASIVTALLTSICLSILLSTKLRWLLEWL